MQNNRLFTNNEGYLLTPNGVGIGSIRHLVKGLQPLTTLQAKRIICHIGPDKGGRWIILVGNP